MSQDKIKTVLDKLHSDIAQDLLDRVKSGEATAAELGIAVKFLKFLRIERKFNSSKELVNQLKIDKNIIM